MDSSRTGRRRWTDEKRQQLLARYHQSQLTQRDFAVRHGMGLSTLGKWLRDADKAPLPSVTFQEVALPQETTHWTVELVSPQGWIVRLQNGSTIPTLPQLLRALPC